MQCGLKPLLALAAIGSGTMSCMWPTQAMQPSLPSDSQAPVAEGQKVFQATCSSQYCHGPGGSGGLGPRLVNHPLSPEYVSATVRDGRTGTNMASFKNILNSVEIDSVIAYVLSLSTAPTQRATLPRPSEPSSVPVAIGRETGTPSAGAEIFFDSTRLSSCRTCHTYDQRGGPLGVDFAAVHHTAEDILGNISRSRIAALAYPVIAVTTDGGEKLTGVRASETADTLQVFDVAMPPVRRSIKTSRIVNIRVTTKGIFDHTKLGLSRQQLLDVAAFLGSH